jgi:hypothetical protein
MGSVWIDEDPPGGPVRNGPQDVLERLRSGVYGDSWYDKAAREQERADAKAKAARVEAMRDRADMLRMRGVEPMTAFEAAVVHGEATFAEQDRADRRAHRQMAQRADELAAARIAGLQGDLAKEQAKYSRALRQANSAHAARRAAEEETQAYRDTSHRGAYHPYYYR